MVDEKYLRLVCEQLQRAANAIKEYITINIIEPFVRYVKAAFEAYIKPMFCRGESIETYSPNYAFMNFFINYWRLRNE